MFETLTGSTDSVVGVVFTAIGGITESDGDIMVPLCSVTFGSMEEEGRTATISFFTTNFGEVDLTHFSTDFSVEADDEIFVTGLFASGVGVVLAGEATVTVSFAATDFELFEIFVLTSVFAGSLVLTTFVPQSGSGLFRTSFLQLCEFVKSLIPTNALLFNFMLIL